jgi:leader peptidase (prepilin peptidase)/N-methyltransferase
MTWAAGLVLPGATDLDRMVLPTRLIRLTFVACGLGLVSAAAYAGAWGRLAEAAAGAVLAWAGFVVWAVLAPGSLGFGDVRLAGLAGLGLGWFGPKVLIAGLLAGLVVGAVVGVGLVATGRRGWKSRLPLGSFLAAGSIAALVVGAR